MNFNFKTKEEAISFLAGYEETGEKLRKFINTFDNRYDLMESRLNELINKDLTYKQNTSYNSWSNNKDEWIIEEDLTHKIFWVSMDKVVYILSNEFFIGYREIENFIEKMLPNYYNCDGYRIKYKQSSLSNI